MKTSLPTSSRFPRYHAAALLAASLLSFSSANAVDWIGADGLGGNGVWNATNFGGATPTSGTDVVFQTTETLTNPTAVVAISGTARARGLSVYNSKTVTINMAESSALLLNDRVINVGGLATITTPSTSSLTIAGPETGRASLSAVRFYLEGNPANVGTEHRNTLTITGNIDVTLKTTFSAAGAQSSIEILNGAIITTTPGNVTNSSTDGAFYIRHGINNGIYSNNITIKNASVYGGNVVNYGLLQLGSGGVLGVSPQVISGTPQIRVTGTSGVDNPVGGRFEVEGNGLAANLTTRVENKGTLAVGLSDARTMVRTEAASFTLNSRVDFSTGSFLELGIFGNGLDEYDTITIGETGSIHNYSNTSMTTIGTGATLVLKIHDLDYTPVYGQTYSFFEIDPANTSAFEGAFNLSQIDTTLWDLSNFNSAGGWQMTAIPEPGTVSLMVMTGAALAAGAFRRYRKNNHVA